MAKNTKGGLGRGLNSLIGGYEAPVVEPIENIVEEQIQHQDDAVVPEESKPVVEREVIRAEDLDSDELITIAKDQGTSRYNRPATPRPTTTSRPAYTNQPLVSDVSPVKTPVRDVVACKEFIEEDDGVRIKAVKERQVQVVPAAANEVVSEVDLSVHENKQTDEVPLNLIKPNPDQPRTNFKPEDLEELAQSIEKDGLLQPILVREMGDGYQIIAGERRWQACKSIGLVKVPVRIKQADDDRVLELALIENLQRSDLNPIEEAYGYKRMMERGKKTQAEVATIVSKGRSTVANALRLLDLPEDAQQLLFEEKITAGHARAILSINDPEDRRKLTEKLLNEKLTVREAEAIARLYNGRAASVDRPKRPPMPKAYKTTAKELTASLHTKVRIKSANGKNKIEIEFKDEDDLQRLFELMKAQEHKEA